MRNLLFFSVFLLFCASVVRSYNCNIAWPKMQILVFIDSNDPESLRNYEDVLLASLYNFWTSKHFDIIMVTQNDSHSEEIIEATRKNTDRWSLHIIKDPMPDYIYYMADRLVHNDTEYVAIFDVSTAVSAHVFVQDLFDDTKEVIRPRVNAFVGVGNADTKKKREFSRSITALPEIVRGDTYAPVVIRAEHAYLVREYLTNALGLDSFSETSKYLRASEGKYTTASVVLNILYHFKHDEYRWHLIHENPSKMGYPVNVPIHLVDMESYYPRIAVHVERPSALGLIFHTGHCYSLPANAPAFTKFGICDGINVTTPNTYEWRFSSVNIIKDREKEILAAHLERRRLVEQCFRLIFNV